MNGALSFTFSTAIAMPISRILLIANLLAALLLTMSVTMLTDFTHRLLSADPDGIGISAISVQALFTVVASSSFTSEGWSLLPQSLARMQATDGGKARLRLSLSAVLFVIVGSVWYLMPPRLAQMYNARGFNLPDSAPAAESARDYRRAIALDPTQPFAYYNLGSAFETFYRYDDAVAQYEQAIAANPADPQPYSNLARVLLLDAKPTTALQIASDGLALNSLSAASLNDLQKKSADATNTRNQQLAQQQLSGDLATIDALHKNRAEAEFDLGFYPAAIADANASKSAAAQCILGQTYAKLGQTANAQAAWTKFIQIMQTPASSPPMAQPSCSLLAEEQHEKQ